MSETNQILVSSELSPAHDCIAVCAPGVGITLVLLYERVLLWPTADPNTLGGTQIVSEEVYDLLIRAEQKPVSRLLFLTPHTLFSIEDPENEFKSQAMVRELDDKEISNWHLASEPTKDDSGRSLTLLLHHRKHQVQSEDDGPFDHFKGEIGKATISIPKSLLEKPARAVMYGLRRTAFVTDLDPPIKVGDQRWLRILLKPRRLHPPAPRFDSKTTDLSPTSFCQILDVLGPDTMLESFRSVIRSMSKPKSLPKEFQNNLDKNEVQKTLDSIANTILDEGFDMPGTYTRIEDHRIILVPQTCRLHPFHLDGCVRLHAIVPVTIGDYSTVAYQWYAGLKDFAELDPLAIADRIDDYVGKFAPWDNRAKPKAALTYATQADHLLGCDIIDEMQKRQFLRAIKDAFGETDLLCRGARSLPSNSMERFACLAEIAAAVGSRKRLAHAHFRVLLEAHWSASAGSK